mgnify:FL=1
MKNILSTLKTKMLLGVILSYLPSPLYAQSEPVPVITRPSAEAQALEKYGEIPTDLYTGRVNIDIPLLNITEYDINVPMKINYFGGGIKVMEEDGPIGLGWTLCLGGMISRSVCGMPDEMYDSANKIVGYNRLEEHLFAGMDSRKEFVELITNRTLDYNPYDQYRFTSNYCSTGYMSCIYGEQYDQGHFDTAQDTYCFNFMGFSGVFTVNKYGHCTLQTENGISIQYTAGLFSATDLNGYTYRFEQKEFSKYRYRPYMQENNSDNTFEYPSAWWLTSIISPNGEHIDFHYKIIKDVTCAITDYPIIDWEYRKMYFDNECKEKEESVHNLSTPFYNTQTTDKILLNSIVTRNSITRFEYEGNDCHCQLKTIKYIPNKLTENIVYKTIRFYRSCFKTYDNSRRTKLDSLKITGDDSITTRTFKFGYTTNEMYGMDIRERDHWGYWNPFSGLYPAPANYFNKRKYNSIDGGNRHAYPDGSDMGMLHSITYPPGRQTELIWEPNTFSKLGLTAQRASISDNSFFETLEGYQDTIAHQTILRGKRTGQILETSCNIWISQSIQFDFSQYYPKGIISEENSDPSFNTCITGWTSNDTIYGPAHLPYVEITFPDNTRQFIRINKYSFNKPISIRATQRGMYKFKLKNPAMEWSGYRPDLCGLFYDIFEGPDCSDCGRININYYTLRSSIAKDTYPTGGCRIKIIKHYSGNDTIIKLYNYSQEGRDPNSPSSGVLTYIPRYGSITAKSYQPISLRPNDCYPFYEAQTPVITLTSHPIPTTLNGGSHIEYSKITENIIKNGHMDPLDPQRADCHETIYEYITSADSDCADIDETEYREYVRADMLKLTSQRYKRGLLKRKTEYTDEKTITDYLYDIPDKWDTPLITGSLFTVGDYVDMHFLNHNCAEYGSVLAYKDYGIVKYRVIPYNKRIEEIRTSGEIKANYQKYTYADRLYSSNNMANAPISYSTIDSQGDTVTLYYTYTRKNKIHTCVTTKQGRIVDAYRNEYNTKSQLTARYIAKLTPNRLPLASSYGLGKWQFITENQNPALYQLTNILTESYQYDRDRLVQVTDETSGVSTVYLWGYNGTHPIAEIRNATFANVTQCIGGDYMVNQLYNSYTPNIDVVNALRSTLINSQVTTMTFKLSVGVTSITDARGIRTSYEYGPFGDLKNIRDLNDRLLQTIQIHYIGEYL